MKQKFIGCYSLGNENVERAGLMTNKASNRKRRPLVKRKITVPIYDAVLWIVVTDHIAKERRKWEHIFGPAPEGNEYDALCSHSGGHNFGLFFERKPLSMKIIAHEVFHLTHRMLEWVSANFDTDHHEQGSMLCGYLMDLVCREAKCRTKTR